MSTLKIIRKIDCKNLYIEELNQFIGKKVEIVIKSISFFNPNRRRKILNLAGSINGSSDPLQYQKKMRSEWNHRI